MVLTIIGKKNSRKLLQGIKEKFVEITEGSTKILVLDKSINDKVPPKKPVFFNPAAKLNRDFSILAYSAFWNDFDKPKIFLDGLAGVGARSLRVANEIKDVEKVVMNDVNLLVIVNGYQTHQVGLMECVLKLEIGMMVVGKVNVMV